MSNILLSKAKSMLGIYLGDILLFGNAFPSYIILSIYSSDIKGY